MVLCPAQAERLDDDQPAETLDAERLVKRAIECGSKDAVALASSGIAIGYMFNDFERAMSLMDRAQELNPNLAMEFHLSGGSGALPVSPTWPSNILSGRFVSAPWIHNAQECWPQ